MSSRGRGVMLVGAEEVAIAVGIRCARRATRRGIREASEHASVEADCDTGGPGSSRCRGETAARAVLGSGPVRALLMLVTLVTWPSARASAQVTLVVRASGDAYPGVEAAVENDLRESLGGSVRRVDSPLDELALAAGCDGAQAATTAPCVATIAQAASARLVAIEHLTREGAGWRASIDLRRADGTQVSLLSALCDETSCAPEAMAEADTGTGPEAVDDHPEEAHAHYVAAHAPLDVDHRVPTTTPPAAQASSDARADDAAPAAPRSIAILPHALFVGATLVGIGSFVAGGVALAAANEATSLGPLENAAQVDRERALEEQNAIALGVGIGLATCGAALAIAGIFTLSSDGPRLLVGLGHADLSVSF
jgi:hypothetical protein